MKELHYREGFLDFYGSFKLYMLGHLDVFSCVFFTIIYVCWFLNFSTITTINCNSFLRKKIVGQRASLLARQVAGRVENLNS